jgi:hypothetical protein
MLNLFPQCIGLAELKEYFNDTSLKFPIFYPSGEVSQKLTPGERDIQLRHNSRVARGESYADIALELAKSVVDKDKQIKKLKREVQKLKANNLK